MCYTFQPARISCSPLGREADGDDQRLRRYLRGGSKANPERPRRAIALRIRGKAISTCLTDALMRVFCRVRLLVVTSQRILVGRRQLQRLTLCGQLHYICFDALRRVSTTIWTTLDGDRCAMGYFVWFPTYPTRSHRYDLIKHVGSGCWTNAEHVSQPGALATNSTQRPTLLCIGWFYPVMCVDANVWWDLPCVSFVPYVLVVPSALYLLYLLFLMYLLYLLYLLYIIYLMYILYLCTFCTLFTYCATTS